MLILWVLEVIFLWSLKFDDLQEKNKLHIPIPNVLKKKRKGKSLVFYIKEIKQIH